MAVMEKVGRLYLGRQASGVGYCILAAGAVLKTVNPRSYTWLIKKAAKRVALVLFFPKVANKPPQPKSHKH